MMILSHIIISNNINFKNVVPQTVIDPSELCYTIRTSKFTIFNGASTTLNNVFNTENVLCRPEIESKVAACSTFVPCDELAKCVHLINNKTNGY